MVDIILWVILPGLAFGIMMFFFAWAGSVMARRRITRLLQPGETVLRKAETLGRKLPRRFSLLSLPSFLVPLPWQGTLYLMNSRLIWRRYLFAVRGPSLLDIPLGRIDHCSVKRIAWWGSLEIKAGGEHLILHPYRHYFSLTRIRNRDFAEDMAKAINEARGRALGASP